MALSDAVRVRSLLGALPALILACGDDPPAPSASPLLWACPAGWIASARGGCGPATLLCAQGGAAAPNACEGADGASAPRLTSGDGVTVPGIRRGASGALEGAWPGSADAPSERAVPAADWVPTIRDVAPPETWTPTAGPTNCGSGWPCTASLRTDCPAGSAPLPSGACVAVGDDTCATGEWPAPGAPETGVTVVYVRGGATGGDGSAERPFATIAEALTAVSGALKVVLADGEHPAPGVVDRRVTLIGRCASHAVLVRTGVDAVAVTGDAAVLSARGVTLRGVSLRGRNASIALNNVVMARAPDVALYATGGRVSLRDVLFDGGVGVAELSGAMVVEGSAELTGERVVVRRAPRFGVVVTGTLTLTDSVVSGTVPGAAMAGAPGVSAQAGGIVTLRGSLIEANVNTGVAAIGMNTHVTLEGCVVRATTARASGVVPKGVSASQRGSATVRGCVIERNNGSGAYAEGRGATLDVRDTLFRANAPANSFGVELSAQDMGVVTATGVHIMDARGVGLQASGGTLTATRAWIERVDQDANGGGARAVQAQSGGTLDVTDLRLSDATGVGVVASGPEARVTLHHALVVGGAPASQEPVPEGISLIAVGGGAIDATGVRVVRAFSIGAAAQLGDSQITLRDSAIEGVTGRPTSLGQAVDAERGGVVTLRGVRLANATRFAVSATGENSVIDAEDVLIEGTRADAVNPSPTVVAGDHAAIRGARVCLRDNATGGVLAIQDARVVLRELRVSNAQTRLGYGVTAQGGGSVEIAQVRSSANREAGLFVAGANARATVTDAVIEDTRSSAQGGGYGVRVQDGGALTLRRARVERNERAAISARGANATLTLEDVAMLDTRPVEVGGVMISAGILAGEGTRIDADRLLVSGMASAGIVLQGASLTLRDGYVLSPVQSGAYGGFGVLGGDRAVLDLTRLAVRSARGVALSLSDSAQGLGSRATAQDVYVSDVSDGPVETTSRATPVGYGLFVDEGATMSLQRAVLDGGQWGFFETLGAMRITDGVIARQRTAAGASNGASSATVTLQNVRFVSNQRDEVVRDTQLPEVRFALPPDDR